MEGRRDDACAPSPPPLQLASGLLACAAGLLSPPWSSDVVVGEGERSGSRARSRSRTSWRHGETTRVRRLRGWHAFQKTILFTYSTPSAVFNQTIRSPLVALRMLVCDRIDNVVLVTYQAALR